MNIDYRKPLQQAHSPQQVWDALRALCDRSGSVQDLTLICGTRGIRQSICLVRLAERGEAERIAGWLGVPLFGSSEVLFEIDLSDSFACPKRRPDGSPPDTCVCQS